MSDVEFVNGLIFKMPRDNAPEFVKGSLSIRTEEMITFLQSKNTEWINIDLKVSKAGKAYAQVNTFVPESKQDSAIRQSAPPQGLNQGQQSAPQKDEFSDDIPW